MKRAPLLPSLVLIFCCVFTTLATAREPSLKALLKTAGVAKTKSAKFQDFAELDFKLPEDGSDCKIVSPKTAAEGNPWVWRARFWGHEPDFDTAMLEHGYHVVYCDVVELWGNPQAVARWNKFYSLARQVGLGPKPVLEGMSRGGTYIFNWAKANPTKVAAIYGDNPLLDLKAFPTLNEEERGMRKECFAAYGVTEADISKFKGSPIDGLEGLAANKVPVFFVLGAKDDICPMAQHADILKSRYKVLGGKVTRWVKPNDGHHPHGLHPVEPLVEAVLKAASH